MHIAWVERHRETAIAYLDASPIGHPYSKWLGGANRRRIRGNGGTLEKQREYNRNYMRRKLGIQESRYRTTGLVP